MSGLDDAIDEAKAFTADTLERVAAFGQEMADLGIHVGIGSPGRCVTCGEAWPCRGSRE